MLFIPRVKYPYPLVPIKQPADGTTILPGNYRLTGRYISIASALQPRKMSGNKNSREGSNGAARACRRSWSVRGLRPIAEIL